MLKTWDDVTQGKAFLRIIRPSQFGWNNSTHPIVNIYFETLVSKFDIWDVVTNMSLFENSNQLF